MTALATMLRGYEMTWRKYWEQDPAIAAAFVNSYVCFIDVDQYIDVLIFLFTARSQRIRNTNRDAGFLARHESRVNFWNQNT